MKIPDELIKKNKLIPLFKDGTIKYSYYPEIFKKYYGIKIKKHKLSEFSKREFKGNGQQYSNFCGISSLGNYLYNKHHISFPFEYNISELAEELYIAKQYVKNKGISNEYSIKDNGSFQVHLTNVTSFFNLKYFSGNDGNVSIIKSLLDQDTPVIIYRPFTKKDRRGHFLVIHDMSLSEGKVHFFDPAYRGTRPKENIKHNGTYKNESLEEFVEKWPFDLEANYIQNINYFYAFISEKRDGPKGDFKGYYTY